LWPPRPTSAAAACVALFLQWGQKQNGPGAKATGPLAPPEKDQAGGALPRGL
jgi:hypothetical protein